MNYKRLSALTVKELTEHRWYLVSLLLAIPVIELATAFWGRDFLSNAPLNAE